jgi:hypothetical protein
MASNRISRSFAARGAAQSGSRVEDAIDNVMAPTPHASRVNGTASVVFYVPLLEEPPITEVITNGRRGIATFRDKPGNQMNKLPFLRFLESQTDSHEEKACSISAGPLR